MFCLSLHRISLKKGLSIREKMRTAGVLDDFLKHIKYDPVKGYQPRQGSVVRQPITNHLDVSVHPTPCLSLLLPNTNLDTPEPPGVTNCFSPHS